MEDKQAFKNVFWNTLFVAMVAHVLVALAIVFAWFGPAEGVGGNFCEASRAGLIKQPANTFSNLAFAVLGLFAAHQVSQFSFHHYRNALTIQPFFATFFCVLMVLLSPGSIALHATETFWGGYFDMLSMYLIAATIFCYALERTFKISVRAFVAVFVAALAVCHFFHFGLRHIPFPFVKFGGNFIFGTLLVGGGILEFVHVYFYKSQSQKVWGYSTIFAFLLAFAIWFTGRNDHPWCHPYSYLQAHAVWHILNAVAAYCLFRYFISDNDSRYAA